MEKRESGKNRHHFPIFSCSTSRSISDHVSGYSNYLCNSGIILHLKMNVPLVFLPLSLLPPNWCSLLVTSYQKVKAPSTIINWRQCFRHLGSSAVNKTMQVSVGKFGQILSKESGQNVYIWVGAGPFEVVDSFLLVAFPLENSSVHISSGSHTHIPTHFQARISNWSYEHNRGNHVSPFPLKSALFLLSFHMRNDTATLTQQVLSLSLFCFLHIL